jgi:hypothetical protein
MNAAVYDDIYSRLDELVEREKDLRAEISEIQQERARLKSQLNFTDISKPRWVSELPKEFWYPSYYTSKVINDMAPNMEYKNTPPDILDWVRGSGAKEFFINAALGIGVAIIALQIFFFIF